MKPLAIKFTLIGIIIISILSFSCEEFNYDFQIPEFKNDNIETATPEDVKIDSRYIAEALGKIKSGKYKEVHSMLVYKDGKLVVEEYFQGHKYQWDAPGHHSEWLTWNEETQHCVHSVTKSLTSLSIGLAIDHGFIESVHQSIFDYLPDFQHLKANNKEYVTIEHLLTMTSGFAWAEWNAPYTSIQNDQIGIWFYEKGPIEFVLERPLVAVPGTRFNYSGGDMQLLGEILKNATGMPIDEFSKKYLFEPMGIEDYEWWLVFDSGEVHTAGGLKMTPRAMVKIGAMMLNKGLWNGERIISKNWVEKSAIPYPANHGINIPGVSSGKNGYSYTWWTNETFKSGKKIEMYNAEGWGGQEIYIIPELNTTVVFTGANYTRLNKNHKILEKYIIPAIKN